jgi:DNA-binding Lrp family transcriptional regulator
MSAGSLREVLQDLKRLRLVNEAHLTFGPYDALAIIQADDLVTLGRTVFREIQNLPGVVETCTCLMVDSEALEDVQMAFEPAEQGQPDDFDRPYRRQLTRRFGLN